jgi:hypothetical protein
MPVKKLKTKNNIEISINEIYEETNKIFNQN